MTSPPFVPPPIPTDVFTNLTPVMDQVRGVLDRLGLRAYQMWTYVEQHAGPTRGQGKITGAVWTPILPSPRVAKLTLPLLTSAGGPYGTGAVELQKISRTYTREVLMGLTDNGDPRTPNELFFYFLLPRGQQLGQLYKVTDQPILMPLEWRIRLEPINRWLPGPGPQ